MIPNIVIDALFIVDSNPFSHSLGFELNALEFDAATQAMVQAGTKETSGDYVWVWSQIQSVPLAIPVTLPLNIHEILHEVLSLAEKVQITLSPVVTLAAAPDPLT